MPDYSQPGSDGTLPGGFVDWQRGLVYTAHPEIPSLLPRGVEYRIAAAFKRRVADLEKFTAYKPLYERAAEVANTRIAELICPVDGGEPLHIWIMGHVWGSISAGGHGYASAALSIGVVCPAKGAAKPLGLNAPTPAELTVPGQENPEVFASERAHEIYNEFDVRSASEPNSGLVTLSYGEHASVREKMDFQPFVQRAENRARFHYGLLNAQPRSPFQIVHREWFSITHEDFVVAMIHYQA